MATELLRFQVYKTSYQISFQPTRNWSRPISILEKERDVSCGRDGFSCGKSKKQLQEEENRIDVASAAVLSET